MAISKFEMPQRAQPSQEAVLNSPPHSRFETVIEKPPAAKEYPEEFGFALEEVGGEIYSKLPLVDRVIKPTGQEDALKKVDRWIFFKDSDYETKIGVQITMAGGDKAVGKMRDLPADARMENRGDMKFPLAFVRISDPGLLKNIDRALAEARKNPGREAVEFLSNTDKAKFVGPMLSSLASTNEGLAFLNFYSQAIEILSKNQEKIVA